MYIHRRSILLYTLRLKKAVDIKFYQDFTYQKSLNRLILTELFEK